MRLAMSTGALQTFVLPENELWRYNHMSYLTLDVSPAKVEKSLFERLEKDQKLRAEQEAAEKAAEADLTKTETKSAKDALKAKLGEIRTKYEADRKKVMAESKAAKEDLTAVKEE